MSKSHLKGDIPSSIIYGNNIIIIVIRSYDKKVPTSLWRVLLYGNCLYRLRKRGSQRRGLASYRNSYQHIQEVRCHPNFLFLVVFLIILFNHRRLCFSFSFFHPSVQIGGTLNLTRPLWVLGWISWFTALGQTFGRWTNSLDLLSSHSCFSQRHWLVFGGGCGMTRTIDKRLYGTKTYDLPVHVKSLGVGWAVGNLLQFLPRTISPIGCFAFTIRSLLAGGMAFVWFFVSLWAFRWVSSRCLEQGVRVGCTNFERLL